ncbi:MAG: ABC transporter permease [Chloroflexi bacterium]|nr:ABC transporter permease [Chloroflexota bacterium]
MTLLARIVPLGGLTRPGRLFERNLMVYRRTWMVLFSGFFEPLFYLLGIGFGIGSLVGSVTGPGGQEVPYQVFVAPALLASAAMNGAIYDSTTNVFFKLKYSHTYDAVLTTPVGVPDVAIGEIAWALFRGTLYAIGFMVVMLALGLVRSPAWLLALPASILIGFAFASVGMALSTWIRSWADFDKLQLVLLPMFLFSATFYPITAYPPALQVVVELTPLYHGVDLLRGLTTGSIGVPQLVDVGYLIVMGIIGLAVVSRRLARLLLK